MSDADALFIERAERILRNTHTICRRLLDLVDHLGQDTAFRMVQADSSYSRELMVKMLRANAGATDTELFSIANEITEAWKGD